MSTGRFQIVTAPVAPGICRICGIQYGKRVLIDTSLDADFCNRPHSDTEDFNYSLEIMGAVYFCNECVGAMADIIDWISPEKANELRDLHLSAITMIETQRERILGLEAIVNGYQSLGLSAVTTSEPSTPITVDSEESQESTGSKNSLFESPTGDSLSEIKGGRKGSGNSETDKPSGDQINF